MWLHDTVNIVCSLDIMWLRDAVVMSARSWPTHHWVLSSSVIRASHYCMEGRGFKFHLELRIFFCVFLSTHIIFSFIIIKCVTKVVCSTSILKFSSFKNNKSKNSAKYHKILMSRFWEIVVSVPLLFSLLCLFVLFKTCAVMWVTADCRKTVFSHLKQLQTFCNSLLKMVSSDFRYFSDR